MVRRLMYMRISAIGQHPNFKEQCKCNCDTCKTCNTVTAPKKRSVNPFALTGWVGAAGIATAVLGGIFHQKTLHKTGEYLGAIAIGAHVSMAIGNRHCHHHHKDIVA